MEPLGYRPPVDYRPGEGAEPYYGEPKIIGYKNERPLSLGCCGFEDSLLENEETQKFVIEHLERDIDFLCWFTAGIEDLNMC